MSELKSETAYFMSLQEGENVRVYLKDEADAVIAEKDKDITILQQSLQSAESVSSYRKRTIKEYEAKVDRMRTDISEKNTYISNLKNDIAATTELCKCCLLERTIVVVGITLRNNQGGR